MNLPSKSQPSSLLRVLGVGFGIAMLIGNSIGGGIIRMPGIVAAYAPYPSIIISLWILGGVLAFAGALVYAEASAAYQFTGGPFVYSEKIFGKQAGFTIGFLDWFFNLAANSALTVAMSEYLLTLVGVHWSVAVTGSVITIILVVTQWFGIKMGDAIQKTLSGVKVAGLLFLVGAFLIHGKSEIASTASTLGISPIVGFSVLVLALRAITFTYSGWNSPIYFSEENKQPGKSIPRSLLYGALLLTFLYVIVNAALLYMMPVNTLAQSQIALADGANIVFGASGKTIVTILSIVLILSSVYAGILYVPRIIYGMARSGSFFASVSRLNKYQIPGVAMIVSCGICIAIIFSGTFEFIIAISTFLYLFVDTSVYLSMFISRWKQKTEFPFKAPLFPALHLLMIVINLALLTGVFIEDIRSGIYAISVILITVPLYMIFKKQKIKAVED